MLKSMCLRAWNELSHAYWQRFGPSKILHSPNRIETQPKLKTSHFRPSELKYTVDKIQRSPKSIWNAFEIGVNFQDLFKMLGNVWMRFNSLFDRNMKSNQITKVLHVISILVGTIQFANKIIKHFKECAMMPANRNEEHQERTVSYGIYLANNRSENIFTKVSPWRFLVPWQTVKMEKLLWTRSLW